MNIKVLGMGCSNCRRLEENVSRAVAEMGLETTIEKVTDLSDILSYGVSSTPALVVDGRVLTAGRVPDAGQIRKLLAPAAA